MDSQAHALGKGELKIDVRGNAQRKLSVAGQVELDLRVVGESYPQLWRELDQGGDYGPHREVVYLVELDRGLQTPRPRERCPEFVSQPPVSKTRPRPNGKPIVNAVGEGGQHTQGQERGFRDLVAAHPIVRGIEDRS